MPSFASSLPSRTSSLLRFRRQAVALAPFSLTRGVTTLPGVFAVTFTSNVLGAAAVYFAARRYGAPSANRRRAPTADASAIATMEREYLVSASWIFTLAGCLPASGPWGPVRGTRQPLGSPALIPIASRLRSGTARSRPRRRDRGRMGPALPP